MLALTTTGCSLDYGQFLVEGDGASTGTGGSTGSGAAGAGASSAGASSSNGANGGSANGGSANGGSANGGSANGGSAPGGSGNGGFSSGGAGGSLNPPVSCTDQYGDIADFELCTESAVECAFYFLQGGALSCDEACGARGGACISTHNNDGGNCGLGGAESCAVTSHNHAICKCSAGCGTGGPCVAVEQCSSGVCI